MNGRSRYLATRAGLALLLVVVPAIAAAEGAASDDPAPPGRRAAVAALFERLYVSLNAASFDPVGNAGKLHFDGRAYGWGATVGYALNPHVGIDAEFLWATSDHERLGAIIPGTTSNDVRIGTLGLNLNLRLSYPLGRWTPFVTLGAGQYSTDLMTKRPGDSGFTTEGPPSCSNDAGYLIGIGIAFQLREKSWLDLSWRRLDLDADFGGYSSGRIDAGGDLITLSLRYGGG